MPDVLAPGGLRHEIELLAHVRVLEIQRRRQQAGTQRLNAVDRFDRACRTEQVPGGRLGGRDRQIFAAIGENPADGRNLGGIANLRLGRVGVDIANIAR